MQFRPASWFFAASPTVAFLFLFVTERLRQYRCYFPSSVYVEEEGFVIIALLLRYDASAHLPQIGGIILTVIFVVSTRFKSLGDADVFYISRKTCFTYLRHLILVRISITFFRSSSYSRVYLNLLDRSTLF